MKINLLIITLLIITATCAENFSNDIKKALDKTQKVFTSDKIDANADKINEINKREIVVLEEIMARRAETKKLISEMIELLRRNRSTYRLNFQIQKLLYSEKDFLKIKVERKTINDERTAIAYELIAQKLYADNKESNEIREHWKLLAEKDPQMLVCRIPQRLTYELFPMKNIKSYGNKRLYPKLLVQIEANLFKNKEFLEAGFNFWSASAKIIHREVELMKNSSEYLAWVGGLKNNIYPAPDNPLTIAWNKLLRNDEELIKLKNIKKDAYEKMKKFILNDDSKASKELKEICEIK